MQKPFSWPLAGIIVIVSLLLVVIGVDAMQPDTTKAATNPAGQAADAQKTLAATVDEARERARLLHETFHATLQFVHHEYYRPDQKLAIPATTLKRVFDELATSRNVKLRWLAVNAQAMNVDHIAEDEFEKAAVMALTKGQEEFSQVEDGVYRHAGAITLSSECLKCHLPRRTSTKDRTAALVISIPLLKKSELP